MYEALSMLQQPVVLNEFGWKIIGSKKYRTADGDPHDTRNETDKNTSDAILFVNAMQYVMDALSFFAQPRCQHDPCFHHI